MELDPTRLPGSLERRRVVYDLDRSRSRTRVGRIWTYVGDDRHPYTVYDYTPNRSRAGPQAFLELLLM